MADVDDVPKLDTTRAPIDYRTSSMYVYGICTAAKLHYVVLQFCCRLQSLRSNIRTSFERTRRWPLDTVLTQAGHSSSHPSPSTEMFLHFVTLWPFDLILKGSPGLIMDYPCGCGKFDDYSFGLPFWLFCAAKTQTHTPYNTHTHTHTHKDAA